jgi:hypothetical protein
MAFAFERSTQQLKLKLAFFFIERLALVAQ